MKYYVRVDLKEDESINDVFDWITERGWTHKEEWRWESPDYYNLETYYTFHFANDKHATLFVLRWAS